MSQSWDVTLIDGAPLPPADPGIGGRKACHISVQDVDGRWHQLGAGALRGVWPEAVELVSDEYGPKTATFELHRDPESAWPDLGAYAPMDAYVGGNLRWSGRIVDAPTRSADQVISVQAEGWQAHLDDDQYEWFYVHTRLSDWKDQRSSLATTLGSVSGGFVAAPQVNAGDGGITLQWPKDETIVAGRNVGVYLDLGPSGGASRVVVTYEGSNGDANNILFCRGTDDCNPTAGGDDAFTAGMNAGGPYTSSGTFSVPRRYVHLLFNRASSDATASSDCFFRITSVQVFSSTAYESGNASVLRGDHVVTDALDRATMLLASDRSRVEQTTGFYVPEFAPDGPRTPRQAAEAVNVFFDHQVKVDEQRRAVFREKPSVPDVAVGKWGGSSFDDASNASGADVFSRAVARGDDPAGVKLSVTRSQAEQTGTVLDSIASPYHANPSFDADVSGWTTSGTITRDTSSPDSSPASGRWDNTGAADVLAVGDYIYSTAFSGTFVAGVTYALDFALKASASGARLRAGLGNSLTGTGDGTVVASLDHSGIGTTWTDYRLTWTPQQSYVGSAVYFALRLDGGSAYFRVDSLVLSAARPTIVDRRGFRKAHTLDSGFPLTTLSAQRLADKYLAAHRTTPFKGKGQATGHNAIRDYATGQAISPDTLLTLTGGLMHFDHLIDPDTGNLGRDGRLVKVAYRPETDTASFDIDSSRGDFDRTLQRAGVLVGQLR